MESLHQFVWRFILFISGLLIETRIVSFFHQLNQNRVIINIQVNQLKPESHGIASFFCKVCAISRINKRIRSTMLTGTTSASELQHYLEGPLEDMDVDVLSWWKINQLKFPVLSAIARDTLAVPASTVASEASFSASGRVINEYRVRLKPNLVECLVVLKDWDRADKRVQDVDVEKIIKEDLELAKDYASIPDFVEN